MLSDTITEQNIKTFVNRFYQKIRLNADLGPVFAATIGTDDEAWRPHLQRMYTFWSSVMLTTGKYKGNPMQKHKDLPPFGAHMFNIWLRLFAETANELHSKTIAQRYIDKSQHIAESLKLHLYYKP